MPARHHWTQSRYIHTVSIGRHTQDSSPDFYRAYALISRAQSRHAARARCRDGHSIIHARRSRYNRFLIKRRSSFASI